MPRKKLERIKKNIIKIPLSHPQPNIRPSFNPKNEVLYLELLENPDKVKPELLNQEFVPPKPQYSSSNTSYTEIEFIDDKEDNNLENKNAYKRMKPDIRSDISDRIGGKRILNRKDRGDIKDMDQIIRENKERQEHLENREDKDRRDRDRNDRHNREDRRDRDKRDGNDRHNRDRHDREDSDRHNIDRRDGNDRDRRDGNDRDRRDGNDRHDRDRHNREDRDRNDRNDRHDRDRNDRNDRDRHDRDNHEKRKKKRHPLEDMLSRDKEEKRNKEQREEKNNQREEKKSPPSLSQINNSNNIQIGNNSYKDLSYAKNNESEVNKKRELLFKFDILRKKHKENTSIPNFTEHSNLNDMERVYDMSVKRLALDSKVESYKKYLMGGFMIVEFLLGNFLKFDISGFAKQQMLSMNSYEQLLIELGEKSYLQNKKEWPVEVRLLMLIIVNAGFFIVGKKFLKFTDNNTAKFMGGTEPILPKRKMRGPNIVDLDNSNSNSNTNNDNNEHKEESKEIINSKTISADSITEEMKTQKEEIDQSELSESNEKPNIKKRRKSKIDINSIPSLK
jgi:hypothetical protein